MNTLDAACREARDPERSAEAEARSVLHRQRCPDCQAFTGAVEEIREVLHADDTLDEVSRARIQAKLALSFDTLAARPAPAQGRRWPQVVGLLAAAAAGLCLYLWPKDPATRALDVPVGGVVAAQVGPAKLSLVGAAQLHWMDEEVPERLVLERGRLLLSVEHVPERGFIVQTPHTQVAVVGTLYAVEVDALGRTEVDVRRGIVQVEHRGQRFRLSKGQGWSEGGGPRAVRPEVDLALARHAGEPPPESPTTTQAVAPAPAPGPSEGPKEDEATPAPSAPRVNPRRGPPEAPTPTPPSAEARYAEAEGALAAQRIEAATLILEALVREFPNDPLANAALYELAQIAQRQGRVAQAEAHLEELLARRAEPGLAEAGHHLLCRLRLQSEETAAAYDCLTHFRRQFPGSGRDAEVLSALAGLAERRGGCAEAAPLVDEYLRLYPQGPKAAALKAWRSRCAP